MRLDSKPWFFIALVTVAIGISYFNRQALPVAISAIQRNIPISDAQFALLQAAFLACGGAQCGICTPGMILAAVHLLDKCASPTLEQIKEGLSGICAGALDTCRFLRR